MEVQHSDKLEDFEQEFEQILNRCGYWLKPDGDEEQWQQIGIQYTKEGRAVLWRKKNARDRDHYIRFANCFRDVYRAACDKWEVAELFQ